MCLVSLDTADIQTVRDPFCADSYPDTILPTPQEPMSEVSNSGAEVSGDALMAYGRVPGFPIQVDKINGEKRTGY